MFPTMDIQCPNSLLVIFPEELYRNVGSSTVLPQLLEVVGQDNLVAVQFLRGGTVRLTFKDFAVCDGFFDHGFAYNDVPLRVVRAESNVRSVYLRDLPIEVPDDAVSAFFSAFGQVISVTCSKFKDFPTLCDGNRVVKMALESDVPYFVRIRDFDCRVWYSGQPSQCSICRERGHRARDCPLSGLCRRCRQPGHTARECTRAWGSTAQSTDIVPLDVDAPAAAVSEFPIAQPSVSAPPVDDAPVAQPSVSVPPVVAPVAQPVVAPVDKSPVPAPPVSSASSASVVAPVVSVPSVCSATPDEIAAFDARKKSLTLNQIFYQTPNPSTTVLELRKLAPKIPRLRHVINYVGHALNDSVFERCRGSPGSTEFLVSLEVFAEQYALSHGYTFSSLKARKKPRS